MLITGIERYSDRYFKQSVDKGFIKVPSGSIFIEEKTLFIFDDVSALGVVYPKELIESLSQNNPPTKLLKAEELAKELVTILPPAENLAVLDGGGILSYLFLVKAGYQSEMKSVFKMSRDYPNGRPISVCEQRPNFVPDVVLDDILASGQTIAKALEVYPYNKMDLVCLMASANVPKGNDGYRRRERSTMSKTRNFYCARFVNGLLDESKRNLKPAILSLRYLLAKALDNKDYNESYLARKFGGPKKAQEIVDMLQSVNREPINLLRTDYRAFLKEYGVK